jgi:hypothetical protein
MLEDLGRAGGVAVLGLLVGLLPLATGLAYAVWPSEPRLALMRPLSLAAIFAALCTLVSGAAAVLRGIGATPGPISRGSVAHGMSESLIPMFVAFACLTVGWLAVAVGMRRQR